jgi:hypothetical protein
MNRHGKYLPRDRLGGRVPNDAEIIIKILERESGVAAMASRRSSVKS